MSKLRYTAIGTNAAITLADFKSYMHITATTNDDALTDVLKQATIRIQEYADVALLPCTIELEGEGEIIKLYQGPISEITYVKDLVGGWDVDYVSDYRKTMIEQIDSEAVVITYTTLPTSAETERLLNYVYEMASAMWDGNTEEQNKVYQRIPINLR
jgi:hypothetical protein